MKVCLVSGLYPPHALGGAERYVATLAERLGRECEVVVLAAGPPGWGSWRPRLTVEQGVHVYRFFPTNTYFLPRFARASAARRAVWHLLDVWNPHTYLAAHAVLAQEQPDVVHLHNPQGLSTAALSAATRLRLPQAVTLHDYGLWCRRGTALHGARRCGPADLLCRLHERVQRQVTRQVALALAPSRFALEAYRRRGFFPGARWEKLPLPAGPLAGGASGPACTVADETFDVTYIGQLAAHKGVSVLLRAFRSEPDPTWRLHLAGSGDDEPALHRLAAGDSRVRFLGHLGAEQCRALLARTDVVVIPSVWDENAPLVALEAFQAGRPIVAARVGGLPELVQPGVNGVLVPPGDAAALRQALRQLADAPPERDRLAAGARAALVAHDLDTHARTLLGWYQELLAPERAPVPG